MTAFFAEAEAFFAALIATFLAADFWDGVASGFFKSFLYAFIAFFAIEADFLA